MGKVLNSFEFHCLRQFFPRQLYLLPAPPSQPVIRTDIHFSIELLQVQGLVLMHAILSQLSVEFLLFPLLLVLSIFTEFFSLLAPLCQLHSVALLAVNGEFSPAQGLRFPA